MKIVVTSEDSSWLEELKKTSDVITDWQELPKRGLGVVVDPMVLRCGELFLKGAHDVVNPDEVLTFLAQNLHAVGTFFDTLILNDKIPVFNYADTFDHALDFDNRVLTRINDYEQVLYDIDVTYEVYTKIKSAALDELRKLYKGPATIKKELVQDIRSELSTADYQWNPHLGGLEGELQSEEEKILAKFFLGGIIFGGYAQLMESEHHLQPKRSRLFLAATLEAKSAGYQFEDALFAELKARANTPCEDLPWRPTFFPYLLSKANSPMALLQEVVKLRRSSQVSDYRDWFQEAMEDWKNNGRISVEKTKDVRKIAQSIDRVLGVIPSTPKIEVSATITDVIAGTPPGSIDVTPPLSRLWGWCLASLPGKRYRKLLTRAIIKDHEYRQLDKRIRTVWLAA